MEPLPRTARWQLWVAGQTAPQPDRQAIDQALAGGADLLWLDVTAPTSEDMETLRCAFDLHELALDDALKAGQRVKIESYPGHSFITFYAATYDPASRRVELAPLHLFVAPTFLVSVHPTPVQHIDDLLRRLGTPALALEARSGAVLYALLDAIVDAYFPIVDAIGDEIAALEDRMFTRSDDEEDVFAMVFLLKKELLRLRRRVAPQRDVLNVLLRHEQPIFRTDDVPYLQDLYDHLVRLAENIDLYRDLLTSALDSHLSYQSNRLNRVVEVLTVASIILMTSALITGIYGMNFDVMPGLHWAYGYLFALSLMTATAAGLVLLFRHRGWL